MPESPSTLIRLEKPIEMTGKIPEDKAVFYEIAKDKIKYQTRKENRRWREKHGITRKESTATHAVQLSFVHRSKNDVRQFVEGLEIVVNQGYFKKLSEEKGPGFMLKKVLVES
jgi:hypothetical protein